MKRRRFQPAALAGRACRFTSISRQHDTVLYLVLIAFDKLEKVVNAMDTSCTVPQQFLLLRFQFEVRPVYREIVFNRGMDKIAQPLAHHFAFPADDSAFVDRQTFIRYHQIFIDAQHLPESFACGTGAQRIVKVEHHLGRLLENHPVSLETF